MSIAEDLRAALTLLSDDDSQPDATLNKQLKLLELYIEGLTTSQDKCRLLLKSSGPYLELCTPTLLSAFQTLGFRDTEGSWVFARTDTTEIAAEKDNLLSLLTEYRRYSLEEISQYVSRGEKPPGIKEVDDHAVAAQHSEAKLPLQPRPWERCEVEAFEFGEDAASNIAQKMEVRDAPHRRHNSEVNIREAFPPTINQELPGLEDELKKIQDELNTSDKRHLGSVIGAGIFGVLGFLLLSPTVVGGIAGGIVGLGVGHLVGRSLRKRRKVKLLNFNMDKLYQLRLTCLLRLLERKMRSKTPLDVFLRIIERVVSEFRPALVLELHNVKLAQMVDSLIKLLRKDACHTALLNGVAELTQLQTTGGSVTVFVSRLKYFFIPVMELMRQTSPHKAELEVVINIERLLNEKSVQDLLSKHSKEIEAVMEGLLPHSESLTIMCLSPEFSRAAAKIDEAWESQDEPKGNELMLRRCASLMDESPARSSYKQKVETLVIKTMTSAYFDGAKQVEKLDIVDEDEEERSVKMTSRRASIRFAQPPPPILIKATTNELLESSDEEQPVSPLIPPPVALDEITPELPPDKLQPEVSAIDMKVHTYQADFDQLLVIEAEPRNGKTWQQVVDKPGVQVFKKKTEGTPICMIKAFCEIPYSKEVVFRAIWDTEMRSKWDEVFEEFRTIDVQPEYDVLYYMIRVTYTQTPTSLVTRRDWVQRRVFIRDYPDANCIMMHFVSMDHPAMPVKKKVIRAETVISGYVIRPTGSNTCDMTIISQNDIKGLIPKMIVNRFASKAPADWINNLLKGCRYVKSAFPDL